MCFLIIISSFVYMCYFSKLEHVSCYSVVQIKEPKDSKNKLMYAHMHAHTYVRAHTHTHVHNR